MPEWVSRVNDVSWGVGSLLSVISAVRKLQSCQAARAAAESKMEASRAAGRAAEDRIAKEAHSAGGVSPMRRRAAAQASSHAADAPSRGRGRGAEHGAPTPAVVECRHREALAGAAVIRAACELLQAGPGVFGLDTPSELLYLLAGLTNGALGVWMACEASRG